MSANLAYPAMLLLVEMSSSLLAAQRDSQHSPGMPPEATGIIAVILEDSKLVQIHAVDAIRVNQTQRGQSLAYIPPQFHGKWDVDPAECSNIAEPGLEIDKQSIKYDGYVISAKSVRQVRSRSIEATTIVQRDELGGTVYSYNNSIRYELSVDGAFLTEIDSMGSRISWVRCANTIPAVASSDFDPNQSVTVISTGPANIRNHPTTKDSRIISKLGPDEMISGTWVSGDDGPARWLRVDLASIGIRSPDPQYGYIWEGNLRLAQSDSSRSGAAGSSSTLRSDLQARADRFYAAADLSSALEALADIVGVLAKMRDAEDLLIAAQVFEIYNAPGSELALADMTRKNVWTLAQMVSTGLLKGWYARAKETGRNPPIRYEYAEVMVQNVLYAARAGSGDVPGAIADASGDQIDRIKEIAITYQQIRGQNETLVHNALNSALLDLDRYSKGELDYKFVLRNIINSRKIATKLDSTTRRVMRDDTPTRLAIIADLQEVKLKLLRGDDVSVLLESMKAQYQGNVFAKDAAFLLGIPGWNGVMASLTGAGRALAVAEKNLSLTTINNALMMDCFISLDDRGQTVVGFSRGNFWRFGINDQVYHFDLAESSYDQETGEFTVSDKRRAVSVRIRPNGKRLTSRFDYDLVDLNVTLGELRAMIAGFRFCQAFD